MEKDLPVDVAALAEIFARYPEVAAVYLFGSVATGKSNAMSDVDLAIVPKNEGIRAKKLEILGALTDAGIDNVDLVILDRDDIVLNFVAISPNKLIYSVPEFSHGQAFSDAVRRYFDFEPYLRRQRKAYKQRLFDGG
jgi:predicted nucleotidyltransferase